jgi:hypothetical protein
VDLHGLREWITLLQDVVLVRILNVFVEDNEIAPLALPIPGAPALLHALLRRSTRRSRNAASRSAASAPLHFRIGAGSAGLDVRHLRRLQHFLRSERPRPLFRNAAEHNA